MLFSNPQASRRAYPEELRNILSIAQAKRSRSWLSTWRMLSPEPTPLWRLPGLARELGVEEVFVKDESKRSSLGSFKALGAPAALVRMVLREHAEWNPEDLLRGAYKAELQDLVVITATDGNHGRALAGAAGSIGVRCVVVLHKHVSDEREAEISKLGAEIIRVEGNYDASVEHAAELARQNEWKVVSDTSYEGYETVPRDVMQGYGTIVDELLDQEGDFAHFTHVILQGGVGGLAAGIASYLWEAFGTARPTFVVVEPRQADCLLQSAMLGRPSRATGSVDSVMAGLACGETSPLAWRFLEDTIDWFLTIEDQQAVDAMRRMAGGSREDIPIVSGESGAACLAALCELAQSPSLRARTSIDAESRILLINTEGATAPSLYRELVGIDATKVMQMQREWAFTVP